MSDRPSLLVAFPYWKRNEYAQWGASSAFSEWVLDSGAFTAHASGKPVDLQEYTETAAWLLATDKRLAEVFALDAIGDHAASLRNADTMRKTIPGVIPTFHYGGDMADLKAMAGEYEKIALGGMAARRPGGGAAVSLAMKRSFLAHAFDAIWPHRVHGFGVGGVLCDEFPFETVDSSSWEIAWAKFGTLPSLGGIKSPKKRSAALRAKALECEVEAHLRWQRRVRARWQAVHRGAGVREFRARLSVSAAWLWEVFKEPVNEERVAS